MLKLRNGNIRLGKKRKTGIIKQRLLITRKENVSTERLHVLHFGTALHLLEKINMNSIGVFV